MLLPRTCVNCLNKDARWPVWSGWTYANILDAIEANGYDNFAKSVRSKDAKVCDVADEFSKRPTRADGRAAKGRWNE